MGKEVNNPVEEALNEDEEYEALYQALSEIEEDSKKEIKNDEIKIRG